LELQHAEIWSQASALNGMLETQFVEILPGHYGTAGVVYIRLGGLQRTWREIRWLKVAFDDDFNPVCILGNTDKLWGYTAFHLSKSPETLKAATGSPWSDLFHSNAWVKERNGALSQRSVIRYGERSSPISEEDAFHDNGYLIVRGHRNHRLEVNIYALDLNISMQLEACPAPPHDPEGYPGSAWHIWTIDITEITTKEEDVPDQDRWIYEAAKNRRKKKVRRRSIYALDP
jgi:hypothetical protein